LAEVPPLELPVDRPRQPAAIRAGGSHAFRIGADLVRKLRALAARQGTTLFAVVLAAYEALLGRYTGQEEMQIGVAASGRSRPEFEPVVGCFFNVVPVPAAVDPALTFAEHLRRVSRAVRESIALQDFPSHLLAERLRSGEAGLFQATFLWQKPQRLDGAPVELDPTGRRLFVPGLTLEPLRLGRRFARQELELEVVEAGEALLASFEYDASLFHATTVARAAGHLEALLLAVVTAPGQRLADLPLLSEQEQHLLRIELGGAACLRDDADPPRAGSVVDLFAEQARRSPDRPAAVHPDRELTYGELDKRSDELAARLQGPIASGELIGLLAEPHPDALIGLLGILKSGAGFVPLDPHLPEERLELLAADCGLRVLVTHGRHAEKAGRMAEATGCLREVVCLDKREEQEAARRPAVSGKTQAESREGALADGGDPRTIAYVVYTSGSTGRPKGVEISHQSLVPMLAWAREYFGLGAHSRVLQNLSLSFDFGIFELLTTLVSGGTLYFLREEERGDPARFARAVAELSIDTI
ncbi:MAG TPA: AMP-binding protein, partial [Thermoanaerobaculia bacterium]